MRQPIALFSGSGILSHTRSLADFITITSGFRFSVHTAVTLEASHAIQPATSRAWKGNTVLSYSATAVKGAGIEGVLARHDSLATARASIKPPF
jgi:hypothetical protein